jgi:uncharacterized protein (TIGR03067 family)
MFVNSLRVLLIGASLLLLGFAPAPFPKPDRNRGDDQTDVGGTWAFELYETSGRPDEHSKKEYTIEMAKDKFVFVTRNNGRTVYAMRLDPTASPPAFTWSMNNNVMFVGSYRVQKNQVAMIFKYANNVALRPTDFGSKPEYHYVLRRISR